MARTTAQNNKSASPKGKTASPKTKTASPKTKSASPKTKKAEKKVVKRERKPVLYERERNLFSRSALKRLLSLVGPANLSSDSFDECVDMTHKLVNELVRLSACSAKFQGRRSLQKSDIEFATLSLGFPVLAPINDFKKLPLKKAVPKKNTENEIKFKNSTKALRKSTWYQKRHAGTGAVVFAFAPLRRQIAYILQENSDSFGFDTNGANSKVKISKEYKISFQYTLETILQRILADAYNICIIAGIKTLKPHIIRQASLNYVGFLY